MATPLTAGGNSRRILATLGVLGAIGALATVGTYSLFTDSVTAGPQAVTSGTVDVALGTAQPNRLTVGASNVVPGDSIQRAVDVTNAGNVAFASVSLDVTPSPLASLLFTDPQGLRIAVDSCPAGWVEAGTAPAYTYTCGAPVSILAATPLTGATSIPLTGAASLAVAGTDKLRVTLSLPVAAGNNLQNLSASVDYTFSATQRAGIAK